MHVYRYVGPLEIRSLAILPGLPMRSSEDVLAWHRLETPAQDDDGRFVATFIIQTDGTLPSVTSWFRGPTTSREPIDPMVYRRTDFPRRMEECRHRREKYRRRTDFPRRMEECRHRREKYRHRTDFPRRMAGCRRRMEGCRRRMEGCRRLGRNSCGKEGYRLVLVCGALGPGGCLAGSGHHRLQATFGLPHGFVAVGYHWKLETPLAATGFCMPSRSCRSGRDARRHPDEPQNRS